MNGRDKLMELFKAMDNNPEITCPNPGDVEACKTCQYAVTDFLCDIEARKVDYLLANGVIVPPCEVGDKLYDADSLIDEYCYGEVEAIQIYAEGSYVVDDSGNSYSFDDIGKTVFLTKEEAEAKLKELQSK